MSTKIQAAKMSPEESGKDVDMCSSLRCLGYLSSLNLLVAVCLGMYVRWEHTSEPTILVIFILGLFVLGISSILHYYFSMDWASLSLFHLWFGFLQGLLCFLNSPSLETDVKEQVTSYLLLASVAVRSLWALTERMCDSPSYQRGVLTSAELHELLGFAIASTSMVLHKSGAVIALLAALAAIIIDLRMKSLLALPNLVFFSVVISVTFFQALRVHTNPFALGCYLGRLICEPLLDVYFSGLSVTERWMPFLLTGRLWRRLSLLPLAVAEMTFFVLCALKLSDLQFWYLVIPGFCVFGLFWILCHMVLLITVWGFHTKLSECQKVRAAQRSDVRTIDRVMASRGMRHFCLISERLVFFSLVSTAILGAVSWQLSNALFMSMFLMVLSLESLAHGLFHELGNCLGGTSVGYAVIVPINFCSVDGQPALLPHEQVLELNARSTAMLSAVQRLFSHHLVQTFGCDYSTSGLALEALQAKLRSFLELRTADGPRHDTYLIYYSGHTLPSGDWALAGGDCLRLEQILDMWKERNVGFSSRLLLVLDTANAMPWVKAVRRVEGLYVAVQGAELSPAGDAESQNGPRLGDFTSEWVEYNCNPDSGVQWSEQGRLVTATYGVSKCWSDYTLHLPTGCDVAKHWKTYFPRATYPLVTVANWCCGLNLLWLCSACLRCIRRLKLVWFPPTVLDTGQGIKLVRS
ncbi:transmembrane protein 168-A [Electrophorus electricus]|uniref:Transmembrane protein 168b n=1 Tax=Electrophorus electricus TaxID=8005 RepID=A0A4W4F413_ELEEL|nr:transmembrane protein 168-A [Electrophorus electricus]XP_026875572.2 transmembrane protein 168-A [Electrophorus electricus]XP_026875573.2 transmembrane protein 168-A [Electrophorus electricus]XP_035384372.1 transmembrane protein 168-A [Electrophorus electricus]